MAKDKEYIKQRSQAAKWIYDRKDKAQWWNWPVLTNHNNDPESLSISDNLAFLIFTDLSSRGLLLPFTTNISGQNIGVSILDLSNENKWEEVINPPGFLKLFVWRPAGFILRKWLQFIIWLASIIITAIITKMLG